MATKLLEVKELFFAYEKEPVLENISFEIEQGDFFAITGPNGGGKSTLIQLILKILPLQKGEIIYHNIKKEDIGYVPQNNSFNLDFPITVLDIVMMGNGTKHQNNFFFNVKYSPFEIACAKESLKKVGMEKFLKQKVGKLSGGQRQRVFIARALCSHPKLLILDEPTSNIDAKGQKEIFTLLKKLNKTITIVVVTHDLSVISNYANKVLYLNQKGYMHDLSTLNFSIEEKEHFCEIELMQILGEKNA